MIDLGELSAPLLRIAGSIDAIVYVARRAPGRPPIFVSPAVERFFGYTPEEWLGDDDALQRHVHPDDQADLRADVDGWLAGGAEEPLHLKYRLVSKDGRVCWCRESLFAASDEVVAGAMVDVTELKVLQTTLAAVTGAAHPHEALLAFCDALAQALGLREVGWSSAARRERLLCSYGPLGRRQSASWLPPGELPEVAARALAEGRSLWDAGHLATPAPGGVGVLFGFTSQPPLPTTHLARVAEALAQQLVVALERADLVQRLEQTSTDRQRLADALVRANEDERSRLARELHDGAGQTLTAVAIQLDLAERTADAASRRPLQVARQQVEATLEELRRLSHALRPAALDRLGLGEALSEMCEALRGERLEVKLSLPAALPHLPEQLATALFRIAQAALTNVVRHARARSAEVRLAMGAGDREVSLEVEDDGAGFDAEATPRALGLFAMRERALALGGQLQLFTSAGAGTRVRALLPLP